MTLIDERLTRAYRYPDTTAADPDAPSERTESTRSRLVHGTVAKSVQGGEVLRAERRLGVSRASQRRAGSGLLYRHFPSSRGRENRGNLGLGTGCAMVRA